MPADWKTNSTAQTRRGFVLQHLCEEEMRSFWDVLPTPRCEGENVTFLPHCIVRSADAEQSREALRRLSQYKLHSWPALGALFQSATNGQYKGMEHPLIPRARSTPAPLNAFSCSVASGSGKLTPGLQLLFFALALNRWAVSMSTVLCRKESSCANVNVLLTRHHRLHVSNELQLLMHDAQPQWIKTKWRRFLIWCSCSFQDVMAFQNSKCCNLKVCLSFALIKNRRSILNYEGQHSNEDWNYSCIFCLTTQTNVKTWMNKLFTKHLIHLPRAWKPPNCPQRLCFANYGPWEET